MKTPRFRFAFFLLVCLLPLTATAQVVNMPDPHLRTAIETELGKTSGAPITVDEMTTLTHLGARNANISDLTGLEGATNLKSLRLGGNSISDIAPVTGLTNLKVLSLWANSISDISPVEALTNLTELNLSGNLISDLSPVADLNQLTWLHLQSNRISDIAALASLTNLTALRLDRNSISDISVLSRLIQLTELRLDRNSLTDLSPVEALTNLTELTLSGNLISDLSPVADLNQLTWLNLSGNSISSIAAVAGLPNLRRLHLQSNSISDISPVAGLMNLTALRFDRNSISDISALLGLAQLTELRLDRNSLTDLSPLVANTGLRNGDTVDVRENPLSSTSIKTHIPILQSRGVTVEFDDVTHLNFGEPHTVRMIYFLPSDRSPQQNIDTKLDTLIRDVQRFYADEMERHGFEGKTFTFETNETGRAMVHHVDGQFTDSYYHQGTFGKVAKEIAEKFDIPQHIYMVAVDISTESIDEWCGEANRFWDRGGREFIMPASGHCFNLPLAAHELGHTFGLDHDFRNDAYIMSYGRKPDRLSKCAAEWLDANRFFNFSQTSFNEFAQINKRRVIQMLPPLAYSSKAIRLRFEVTDTDGLHQAQLIIPTTATDPVEGSGIKLHGCKSWSGKNRSLEFITTELAVEPATEVILQVIDVYGSITRSRFAFTKDDILPDQNARTPTKLEKISGDNHHGLSITPLPNPLVVKVTDQNGFALEEVAVTFTVTAGGGTLSVTRTTTDKNGAAQSTLSLGPNLGVNTVSVSAAGIGQPVIFNAVARAAVEIPDSNLRTAIETALGKASGAPITADEMATLTRLEASEAGIRNLTGLEGATNLIDLGLWKNSVKVLSPLAGLTKLTGLYLGGSSASDLSPLVGLTNLESLFLDGNGTSDLSPLAGLTKLTRLALNNNSVSDLSPLVGLTNLKWMRLASNNISDISPLVANTGLGSGDTVDFRSNPLSYSSIQAHIPALKSRGAKIEFDNRTLTSPLKISGDDKQGTPGTVLERPFVVEVRDTSGSAFEGVPVTFTATGGGGTLSVASTTTDKNGRAESRLTLGPNPGTNTVTVSVAGITQAETFNAEGVRIPKTLEIVSGENQKGLPGAALDNPFVVEVRDQTDKPLPDAQVTFSVTSGGGTLSSTSATTDSSGRAESTLTLGPNPGTNTVTVSVAGIQETRTFTAESIRIPKRLEIVSGKDQKGLPGEALAKPFVVEVRDQTGEPLLGIKVTFSVTNGGGTLSATSVTTNSNGSAESILTLGPNPGTNTVEVGVRGIQEKQSVTAIAELPPIPQDVNRDDVVNILDLVLVASVLGDEGRDLDADVNRDGVVNILDLVMVAGALGKAAAAPSVWYRDLEIAPTRADVGQWLAQAQTLDLIDAASREGVLVLDQLLAVLAPKETILLPNYPNPFNPETWIPYRLAEDTFVTLTIYSLSGQVVRTLDVGHRMTGFYESRSKAIYWDGKNGLGERVASGIYFYTLKAGDYSATRKMVILQ